VILVILAVLRVFVILGILGDFRVIRNDTLIIGIRPIPLNQNAIYPDSITLANIANFAPPGVIDAASSRARPSGTFGIGAGLDKFMREDLAETIQTVLCDPRKRHIGRAKPIVRVFPDNVRLVAGYSSWKDNA
jgi:hypothetical protein